MFLRGGMRLVSLKVLKNGKALEVVINLDLIEVVERRKTDGMIGVRLASGLELTTTLSWWTEMLEAAGYRQEARFL
jgi:hypothetical protein